MVALLIAALPAVAQDSSPEPAPVPPAGTPPSTGYPLSAAQGLSMPSPILTVDQDKLFADSEFGKRVAQEIETRSRALAAENRKIEAQLTAEEKALTEERPNLAPDVFRAKADAFDAKVQRIRAEQEAKSQDLTKFRDSEQKRFGSQLGAILADIARARGAVAVLDRRTLLVSADGIDITNEAVAEVDRRLGDGSEKK